MKFGPLYHWSPVERSELIRREGLQPGSEPVTSSARMPYVCLGTDPAQAWALSGAMDWVANEIEEWDLWLVRLVAGDDVRPVAAYAPEIKEVRVHGVIGPDRLWHVGRRKT